MTLVVSLSLLPKSSFTQNRWWQFEYSDKIIHLGFYLIMAISLLYGFKGVVAKLKSIHYLYTLAICLGLGIVLEFAQQSDLISRHFEILDIIANIIGALLGSVLFLKIYKYLPYGSRN
jgi:VanZ family protein